MGFKVTIRRNGAVCGEAHYKSEAVAAGIATKAAKTNPDVSTVVTRCNGAGCGCGGVKANRRRNPAARRAAVPMADVKAAVLAGADGGYLTDVARAPALRGVHFGRIQAAAEALAKAGKVSFDGVTITRKNTRRRNPMENITSSPRGQTVASRIRSALGGIPQLTVSKVSVSGMPGYEVAYVEVDYGAKSTFDRMSLPSKVEQALGVASHDVSLENDYGDGSYAFSISTEALKNPRRRARALPRRRNAGRDPFAAVRRDVKKEVARYADEGGTFAIQRLMNAAYRVYDKHMATTGEQLPVEAMVAEIGAARTQAEDLHRAQLQGEIRGLTEKQREAERHRFPRRNGTTSANIAASRSLVHRSGLARNRRPRRNSGSMTEAQASTLIRQMGGMGKLTAMVGATGFGRGVTDGHPSLTFKFKGSKKANVVTIILDPSDTYTLRFAKMGGAATFYKMTPAGEFSGVYADALKPTFEQFTGLYLSL